MFLRDGANQNDPTDEGTLDMEKSFWYSLGSFFPAS